MAQPIVIVDYDPKWTDRYDEEALRLLGAIGDKLVALEHIGSTAVPGLGAKPIIDIMFAVSDISDAHDCITPLNTLGYQYIPYPDFPERLFFRDGPIGDGPHHLHATKFLSDFWEGKLLFRNYLRTHPVVAQQYYVLKNQLAKTYGADRKRYEPYTEAKSSFIESVLAKART